MNTHQFFVACRFLSQVTDIEAVMAMLFPNEPLSGRHTLTRLWDKTHDIVIFYHMLGLNYQKDMQKSMEMIAWGVSTTFAYSDSVLPEPGQVVMVSQDGEIWHRAYYTSYAAPHHTKLHFGAVLEKAHLDCILAYELFYGYMRKPLIDDSKP